MRTIKFADGTKVELFKSDDSTSMERLADLLGAIGMVGLFIAFGLLLSCL